MTPAPAPERFDVLVLGAGAAGLFCAGVAGERGRRVLVLEGNARPGLKVLVSGGGRANFTNRIVGPEHYVSHNAHFARSALARYPSSRFIELVEQHGIPYHERAHGQLFCDESAKRITSMLLARCDAVGAQLRTGVRVSADDVRRLDAGSGEHGAAARAGAGREAGGGEGAARFAVRTPDGLVLATSLVVASGGRSWPRLGTSDLGYELARRFGVGVLPLRPGLVPLQWSADDRARFGPLSGIAVPAAVSWGRVCFEEAVLFTHGGLSGPAILQISNHWRPGDAVGIDWLPGHDLPAAWEQAKARGERRTLSRLLSEHLPRRLVDALVGEHPASARPLAQVGRPDLSALAARVKAFAFVPAGDAGWDKAEVTLGGVDTADLSSRTLEARAVPGLHFVGEVVDVTGWLGGFNFQWAWASAHAAGEAV